MTKGGWRPQSERMQEILKQDALEELLAYLRDMDTEDFDRETSENSIASKVAALFEEWL